MTSESPKSKFNPYKILGFIFHLPNFLKLLFRLCMDKRVGLWPKTILALAAIYVISPIDLLPDMLIPILGFAEDILILFLVLKAFVRLSPPEVVWEHVRAIEAADWRRVRRRR